MIKELSTRVAYGDALVRLGEEDERIVALNADLSGSSQTAKFGERFPERFFNMGVAEQDMIGTAAGLATSGKIPFASTFAIFATGRAWEQVRQTLCYSRLNVNLVASHGGITVGEDGATHHAVEDMALMRVLPNMTVIVPSDYHETTQAVYAVASHPGPCYIRTSRGKTPVINEEGIPFSIGKASILREGQDVTLIGIGLMVAVCLEAADLLEKDGVSAGVVNMSTLKPLDTETIVSAAKTTGAIVTAEEHSIIGGLGSAVAETLGTRFPVPLKMIGVCDKFGMSGEPRLLLEEYGLTARHVRQAALASIEMKEKHSCFA
jgi:transketolase